MIEFRCLGALDLRNSDGELRSILSQPKRLALFAWLVLEKPRGFQSRDRARAMFWPELDDARARRALNRAIYWLRSALGEHVLVSRGDEEIGVALDQCWTDVSTFEAAIGDGRLPEALDLYRGDLLRGFFVSDAAGFERWLDAERNRLCHLAHEAGRALVEAQTKSGHARSAMHWARWTLDRFPSDEASLCRLMTLLEDSGDRAGALQVYDQFARQLAADFELQPMPETDALAAAIRARVRNAPVALATDNGSRRETSATAGTTTPIVRRVLSWSRIALAGVASAVALSTSGLLLRGRIPGQDAGGPAVIVHPFENRTGDRAFDYITDLSSDWLLHGLARAGAQAIASRTARAGGERVSSAGRGRHGAAIAGAVVQGAFYHAGGRLRFEGNVAAPDRRVLWTLRSITAPADSPELALAEVRDRVAGAIAVLSNPRFASWLPLGAATPPRYEALHEFMLGDEQQQNGRSRDALPHLTNAAALDPAFTLARVQAAAVRLNLLDLAGADSLCATLNQERTRLTPLEAAWLDWIVAVIREDDTEADRATQRAAALAPDRFLSLRAEVLRWLNRPNEIVTLLRSAGPGHPYYGERSPYWERLAESLHKLGEHPAELAVARRMRRNQPAAWQSVWVELRALAALGRGEEVMSGLDDLESLPRHHRVSAGSLMGQVAEELRAHGDSAAASAVFVRAIDWYRAVPLEQAARIEQRAELGRILYLASQFDEADAIFRRLVAESEGYAPEFEGTLGVIAARRGDRDYAEHILASLERHRLALNPPPRYALFAQARIVAALGDANRAVRMLREAIGGQGRDLHSDTDFEPLVGNPGYRDFIRPKG